jgi:hypothetical protein
MSIVTTTKEYAIDVAKVALNSFTDQARGDIAAPDGNENVSLYTAKGGSAVTLASTTTSAAVVYDPEASFRNGQLNVNVFERNSSNAVTNVQTVNLGRPSAEFLAAGLLSSGLKVFNSSGVDVIGGTQSAAVITSVPQDISTITSTDLANFCANHERDLASGVVSREDATMTNVLTSHFGSKMCLSRGNTSSNIVQREWDDSLGSRRTTVGQSLGPVVDVTIAVASNDTDLTADVSTLLGTDKVVMDTDNLTGTNNPLTLATYRAVIDGTLNMSDPDGTGGIVTTFRIIALDAADKQITDALVVDITTVADGSSYDLRVRGSVTSDSKPIARVVVVFAKAGGTPVTEKLSITNTVFRVSAVEETSDIPARPVHVCVLEGLNASATININSSAVIAGIPDSTNVFIGSGRDTSAEVDTNAVAIFLRSLSKVMPRAFTVAGHGTVERTLTAMYRDEPIEVAFKAMSFSDVTKRVKEIAKHSQMTAKQAAAMLPMLERAGDVASTLPGSIGVVGGAVSGGARMLRHMA